VEAQKALEWGLVQKVAEKPLEEAIGWAEEICRRDKVALGLAKQLMDADEREAGLRGERVAEALLYARKKES
jgi:enoyl-CoA hydratase/carnithine racemase